MSLTSLWRCLDVVCPRGHTHVTILHSDTVAGHNRRQKIAVTHVIDFRLFRLLQNCYCVCDHFVFILKERDKKSMERLSKSLTTLVRQKWRWRWIWVRVRVRVGIGVKITTRVRVRAEVRVRGRIRLRIRANPVGKYLFKVIKITLEQRSKERCSNVILMTMSRYLPTGRVVVPVKVGVRVNT